MYLITVRAGDCVTPATLPHAGCPQASGYTVKTDGNPDTSDTGAFDSALADCNARDYCIGFCWLLGPFGGIGYLASVDDFCLTTPGGSCTYMKGEQAIAVRNEVDSDKGTGLCNRTSSWLASVPSLRSLSCHHRTRHGPPLPCCVLLTRIPAPLLSAVR